MSIHTSTEQHLAQQLINCSLKLLASFWGNQLAVIFSELTNFIDRVEPEL
jgi:hypothetical protein